MKREFMERALELARQAQRCGEVPVGAVVALDGRIVGEGYNFRETGRTALGHAEISAIEAACKTLGRWRLDGCDIYVTLEPCAMCAGAVINARFRCCYFGAFDLKAGAAGSVTDLFKLPFPHSVECFGGIMERECSSVLTGFFEEIRNSPEKL